VCCTVHVVCSSYLKPNGFPLRKTQVLEYIAVNVSEDVGWDAIGSVFFEVINKVIEDEVTTCIRKRN